MKKFLAFILIVAMLSAAGYYVYQKREQLLTADPVQTTSTVSSTPIPTSWPDSEFRAIWINFNEMGSLINGKTEEQYTADIIEMLEQTQASGLNCMIIHMRSHSDAFYPSELFPWSDKVAGQQGQGVDYDPLAIFIEQAHTRNLQVHAWINPYRVSATNTDPTALAENNPARIYMTDDDTSNDHWAVAAAGGIYYNPAVPQIRELVLDGVREILRNYEVDGIHYDDYFYPTTDAAFDQISYETYQSETGDRALPLDEWRRIQVDLLISGTYQAVQQLRPQAVFGVSPSASIERNKTQFYADVEKWGVQPGYVDYLCPQLYFGFSYPDEAFQFNKLADEWSALVQNDSVKLCYGLAPYKIGTQDAGSNEWIEQHDLLKRQVEYIRTKGNCAGFALYNYDAFFRQDELHQQQRENLLGILIEQMEE